MEWKYVGRFGNSNRKVVLKGGIFENVCDDDMMEMIYGIGDGDGDINKGIMCRYIKIIFENRNYEITENRWNEHFKLYGKYHFTKTVMGQQAGYHQYLIMDGLLVVLLFCAAWQSHDKYDAKIKIDIYPQTIYEYGKDGNFEEDPELTELFVICKNQNKRDISGTLKCVDDIKIEKYERGKCSTFMEEFKIKIKHKLASLPDSVYYHCPRMFPLKSVE